MSGLSDAIKAMNLAQLMSITDDAVHGKIVDSETIRLDTPWQGAAYTKLTIEGTSLRSGEEGTFEVVFHGSRAIVVNSPRRPSACCTRNASSRRSRSRHSSRTVPAPAARALTLFGFAGLRRARLIDRITPPA